MPPPDLKPMLIAVAFSLFGLVVVAVVIATVMAMTLTPALSVLLAPRLLASATFAEAVTLADRASERKRVAAAAYATTAAWLRRRACT